VLSMPSTEGIADGKRSSAADVRAARRADDGGGGFTGKFVVSEVDVRRSRWSSSDTEKVTGSRK